MQHATQVAVKDTLSPYTEIYYDNLSALSAGAATDPRASSTQIPSPCAAPGRARLILADPALVAALEHLRPGLQAIGPRAGARGALGRHPAPGASNRHGLARQANTRDVAACVVLLVEAVVELRQRRSPVGRAAFPVGNLAKLFHTLTRDSGVVRGVRRSTDMGPNSMRQANVVSP